MTISTSKLKRRWTAPTPATVTTRGLRAMTTSFAHGVFHHPRHKGAVVLGVLDESPWDRLARLLDRVPNIWPKDGWRVTLEHLTCPQCGAWNKPRAAPLVEQDQQGTIFCAACGRISKAAPRGPAAGPRG